jgi:MFS family permease
MPGLKALVDRVSGAARARAISFYTASFSLGTMLSFLIIGEMGERFGWRPAFVASAVAAGLGFLLVLGLAPVQPQCGRPAGGLLDFRPVLRNRPAMGYILGYVSHMWELFTFRAWVVAFLAFAQSRDPAAGGWSPTSVATVSALVAMAASLGGADLALRFDRRRVCALAMLASGGTALVFGLSAALPYWLAAVAAVLYSGLIQIDSAALTTGAMLEASEGRQGATVALHSLLGFSAAFFGPLSQGAILDAAGGAGLLSSWVIAFAVNGMIGLAGPLALRWSRRERVMRGPA